MSAKAGSRRQGDKSYYDHAKALAYTSVDDARASLACTEKNRLTGGSVRILELALRLAHENTRAGLGNYRTKIVLFERTLKRWRNIARLTKEVRS